MGSQLLWKRCFAGVPEKLLTELRVKVHCFLQGLVIHVNLLRRNSTEVESESCVIPGNVGGCSNEKKAFSIIAFSFNLTYFSLERLSFKVLLVKMVLLSYSVLLMPNSLLILHMLSFAFPPKERGRKKPCPQYANGETSHHQLITSLILFFCKALQCIQEIL